MAFLDDDAEIVIRTPLFPGGTFPGRVTFIADQVDEELQDREGPGRDPQPGRAPEAQHVCAGLPEAPVRRRANGGAR